jgi:hypothetical protein
MGKSDFESAGKDASPGFFREFLEFLATNKKWWMLPIILVLLLFGILIILSGTPAAPFIYTFF